MNETFISYSRKDLDFAQKLFKALKATGIDPWLDQEDIPAAAKWRQEVLVGIQFCHNFIYIISPTSVASEHCDAELDYALSLNKRIIPIVFRLAQYIRPSLGELNWIFFDDFDKGFEKLLELLDSPLGFTFGNRLDSQINIGDKLGNRIFPLYRNQYRIGRNPSASFGEAGLIFLGDEFVSRTHATLKRGDGRWLIIDGLLELDERGRPTMYKPSNNGVYIERINARNKVICSEKLRRLQLRPLAHGEIVKLSPHTSFLYEEISPEHQYRRIEGDEKDTAI